MKPTLQQTQLLRKHLRDTLNYRLTGQGGQEVTSKLQEEQAFIEQL
ncbi:hypothetical protein MUGA111182_02040 [Mucilaginibacter galii]|nr:hypothetical protein [Mucilaginibacter galii]